MSTAATMTMAAFVALLALATVVTLWHRLERESHPEWTYVEFDSGQIGVVPVWDLIEHVESGCPCAPVLLPDAGGLDRGRAVQLHMALDGRGMPDGLMP